jgi:diguanylate cyclase (GGDEF)-like protein
LRSSIATFFKEELFQIFKQNVELLNKQHKKTARFELSLRTADDGEKSRPFFWRLSRLEDSNETEGCLYILLGEDISALRDTESKLMNVFSNIPLGILTMDEHGNIEDTYSTYLHYLFGVDTIAGESFRNVVFAPIEDSLSDGDIKGIDNVYMCLNREERIFESLKDTFPIKTFLYRNNDKETGKHLGFSYKPVSYDGIIKRILIIVEDRTAIVRAEENQKRASQLEKQSREVYESAIRDPLTGLYTRLYMDEQAGNLINNHNRQSISELSLIIFDIDHFKSINDTYGHDAGDLVLQQVAGILLGQVRKTDIAVRFGGEEFLVFLPATVKSAGLLAERVRRGVEETAFEVGDKTINVTISGGIASHDEGEELKAFIKKADENLYQAKHGGRNRIVSE